MEAYVLGQHYVSIADMETHLTEQCFVTLADMRQAGFVTNSDMRQFVTELVQAETEQFSVLRQGMQECFDKTNTMASGFDVQAAAANSEFADRHDVTLAELASRDTQF